MKAVAPTISDRLGRLEKWGRHAVTSRVDRWALGRARRLATGAGGEDRRGIVDAFTALYRPVEVGELPSTDVRRAIVDQFHRLYYHAGSQTWMDTSYRGVPILKHPCDLWVYQEIINELRPEVVIETGTAYGGSAYFLADVCEATGSGSVISIDIEARPDRPAHRRLTYLTGSSVDPGILDRVAQQLPADRAVLVLLDSDHSSTHVSAELEAYAPLVTLGSYVVVEDTNVHGHPVLPCHPPGPMEAVERFLPHHPEFVVDEAREKFMVTFSPSGFLRRVARSSIG